MSQRKLISFDWAMKKLLRSKANFEVLEGFLSELLMEDIRILELLESESNKEEARDKFNDIAKDTLDEWIYFLKNEEIRSDFKAKGIKKAKQELDILKLSDEERRAYERYQDDLHYQASMVESTYTAGVKQGEKRKAYEIALKLIEKDVLDDNEIAEMTGLTAGEVGGLRK